MTLCRKREQKGGKGLEWILLLVSISWVVAVFEIFVQHLLGDDLVLMILGH